MGAPGAVAMLAQELHRLERIDAVAPAAVRDHLAPLRDVAESSFELGDGYRHGAGNVAGLEFVGRSNVQDGDVSLSHQPAKLSEVDRLELIVVVEVEAHHVLHVGQMGVAELLEGAEQGKDIVAGEAVVDVGSVATRLDEAGLAEHAEVCAGVLDGRGRFVGEGFDGALALPEEVEELDAFWAREGVADAGKLRVEGVLEFAMSWHGRMVGLDQYSIEQ